MVSILTIDVETSHTTMRCIMDELLEMPFSMPSSSSRLVLAVSKCQRPRVIDTEHPCG